MTFKILWPALHNSNGREIQALVYVPIAAALPYACTLRTSYWQLTT